MLIGAMQNKVVYCYDLCNLIFKKELLHVCCFTLLEVKSVYKLRYLVQQCTLCQN